MLTATVPIKAASVSARIIRADGSVEDLGVVAVWHRNPLRRLLYRVQRWLGLSARPLAQIPTTS